MKVERMKLKLRGNLPQSSGEMSRCYNNREKGKRDRTREKEKKKRERERGGERKKRRERDRERQRQREGERMKFNLRGKLLYISGEMSRFYKQRKKEKERDRETNRETKRVIERQKDRDRQREKKLSLLVIAFPTLLYRSTYSYCSSNYRNRNSCCLLLSPLRARKSDCYCYHNSWKSNNYRK